MGAAFNAEIEYGGVRFWLADQGRRRVVRPADIVSVSVQPNGYTKLVLKLRKDILVPTSHGEAVQLVKALNALLSERRAVEQRKQEAWGKRRKERPSEYWFR